MSRLRRLLRSPILSPTGLLLRAGLIALTYGVCLAAGLRRYTSAIVLTHPEGVSPAVATVLLAVYLSVHFAFVILAPTLCVAAGLMACMTKFHDYRSARVRGRAISSAVTPPTSE